MPARGTASGRQVATDRGISSGRLPASGRQNVDSSGGGVVDDMTFLEEQVVGVGGSATVTFTGISQAYRHLMVFFVARCDNAGPQNITIEYNGDGTDANYTRQYQQATDASVSTADAEDQIIGWIPPSGAPAGAFSAGQIFLPYYSTTTQDKSGVNLQTGVQAASGYFIHNIFCGWNTSNAGITQLVFGLTAGNFVENSRFSLYGIT